MQIRLIRVPLLLSLLSLGATTAWASPFFSIGDGGDVSWEEAILNGNVRPADPADWPSSGGLTPAEQQFYQMQVDNDPDLDFFVAREPELDTALVSDGNQEFDSLVMSWEQSAQNGLPVAAWEYVYDQDPDLSNAWVDFSIFAPPGIWDLSLELIDENGWVRGWFLSMPPAVWLDYRIHANVLSPQGFDFFYSDPLFDITRVVAIRLDEAGNSVVLPNPSGSLLTQWNAWNHLRVVPEPASLTLLALGLAGAGFARRWPITKKR